MACRMYPVQKVDYAVCNYRVKVNGREVSVDTARVSAVPFNRRWPGHQRGIEQTELVNFLSFACEGENVVEIAPTEAFENFVVRPRSLGFRSEITDEKTIKIYMDKPAYFTVEPFGRKNALHVFADPSAERGAPVGDVLYFGAGVHDAGMIELKSNQTVWLDEGALVYGCIHAKDAENIRIVGGGILDNSRNKEKILFETNAEGNDCDVGNAERVHTVQLDYCTNIEIDGITVRDSLVYNIRPVACRNLKIKNVKIIGCWRFNSDGIDMHNCENVEIDNCFIRTFDDSVCVKGFDFYMEKDPAEATRAATYRNGKVYDCFKDIKVSNCTIWNDWGKCLEIGAETRAREICGVRFENCKIIHVTGDVLTCSNGDNAYVHDVTYENIDVEYDDDLPAPKLQRSDAEVYRNPDKDYAPKLIDVGVYCFEEYSRGVAERGRNRNIAFRNIRLYGERPIRIHVSGYDDAHRSSDIFLENISRNGRKIADEREAEFVVNEFCENVRLG